jgi:sterol carrier protein 2
VLMTMSRRVKSPELGLQATVKALLDAGVTYDDVEQAYVGYCYGDSA